MVNVTVIQSKRDNQPLEGVEVADNFKDVSNEYIYFKNTKGKLDLESLDIDGDLCVFNPKKDNDDASQRFAESFDGIFKEILEADFGFAFNLIGKLNWDVLIKKDKISPFFKSDDLALAEAIDTYNQIFKKIIDAEMLADYKECIYDVKVEELLKIYEKNPTEDAYELLKEDFTQLVYHWRFTEFSVNTTILNKLFFDNVVYTKTYDDFKELMDDYEIRVDMFYLNEDIRAIRRQNKKIKQETARLSKMNRDIINSRSWKLTKPLRAMR